MHSMAQTLTPVCAGPMLKVGVSFLQGEHCIEINVTISGYSLTPTSGPYVNPTVSRKICWYKPAIGHIDAELKIDMCLTKKCKHSVVVILVNCCSCS